MLFWYHKIMNKNLPKKAKDIKGAVAIAELRRAHYIIIVLAISLAGIIAITANYKLDLSMPLSIITVVLLSLVALISLATTATHTIFVPFPSIWRHFFPRPVLAPVQKFNAIKQPPFRFRCKLLTFTDFVDLLRGGIVARLLGIVEIWGVPVRNRAG